MGYAHGTKWDDEKIKNGIKEVMGKLNIITMPTSVDINKANGNSALSNAIARHGGFEGWANKLGLEQSNCETRLGLKGEYFIKETLESKGYEVEKMSVKHPYDLLVNNCIKVDVKTAKKYISMCNSEYYTFNLEKKNPTCDIYILVCLNNNEDVTEIYIIPSIKLNQTQIAIGKETKYACYKDKWEYVDTFSEFYKLLK